ncbi:hypothetical protein CRUP_021822 [Coryphaenoides rupestris]|nr:hypothetical protein CRUP_021822 [Coryphaenoides rupestris]
MAHHPAELLLVKDQYELAFHCLSQGLTAEEAGKIPEGLEYYRRGRQHLTQGLEIPTNGERHQGPHWDAARQLQQKMGVILKNLTEHLVALEASKQTTAPHHRSRVLMDPLPADVDPEQRHLYPTLTAGLSQSTAIPELAVPALDAFFTSSGLAVTPDLPSLPPRPSTQPAVLSGDQPPAYTPRPTEGHHNMAGVVGDLLRGHNAGALCGQVGREMLFIPAGVQMFFVAPDGQVSSLFQPGYLRIFTCEEEGRLLLSL